MKSDPILITPDNDDLVRGFDCGKDGMNFNEYVAYEAADDNEARTYVYMTEENKPVAYFSIACSMIMLDKGHNLADRKAHV